MDDYFRLLKASEIDCRVGSTNGKGVSLLLYKDARVDMKLLDEKFGPMGWKRSHDVIEGNLYCTISVYDKETKMWISKQDVGTESFTEKEKGKASDAFKRAGFNWGIGRELYTAPFIWVNLQSGEDPKRQRFFVREIDYNESREISKLIVVDKAGLIRFQYSERVPQQPIAQPTNSADADEQVALAIQELNAAQSRESVVQIWNNYKHIQADTRFMEALKQAGLKYPKQ